jgi:uncharacterized repeat protein (TIGR02543 family)
MVTINFRVKDTAPSGSSAVSASIAHLYSSVGIGSVLRLGSDYDLLNGSITIIGGAVNPVPGNNVTVISDGAAGSGSAPGNPVAQGTAVTINAGTRQGYNFGGWTTASAGVALANAASASTSFTMPGNDVTVTASWTPEGVATFPVTVNGTVVGNRAQGDTVSINAGTRSGYTFDRWTVDSGGVTLADPNRLTTTFVMPGNAVSVTANWTQDGIGIDPGNGAGPDPEPGSSDQVVADIRVSREEALEKIAASGNLVITRPEMTVKLDAAALRAVFDAAGEGDIGITLTKYGTGSVFGIAAAVNGRTVTDFGAGYITVAIPFDAGANPDAVVVHRLRVDGSRELMRSKYENGNAVFTASHIARFTIAQNPVSFTDSGMARPGMFAHITFAAARGLFMGNPDGSFNPRGNITYGQLAAVLANYDGQSFTNFPRDHINWAENNGIFVGVTHEANREATRADMAQMIYNYSAAAGVRIDAVRSFSFTDIEGSGAAAAIIALANAGVISGDAAGTFRPDANIWREEVAAIISNFVKAFSI